MGDEKSESQEASPQPFTCVENQASAEQLLILPQSYFIARYLTGHEILI